MLYEMSVTRKGSPNGIKIVEFTAGGVYYPHELGGLVEPWLSQGVISEYDPGDCPAGPEPEQETESETKPTKKSKGRPKKGANK